MHTQDIERIRARRKRQIDAVGQLGHELIEVLTGQRTEPSSLAQEMAGSEWTGIDIDTLLSIIDQQQAVIEAAGAVDAKTFRPDGFLHSEYAGAGVALFDLRDALAALKGGGADGR